MKHPEDVFGPNPLLEPFAPFVPISALPGKLWHEPLKGVPWHEVAPESRVALLAAQDSHFFPTEQAVAIASAIQEGLRASIMRRNPLLAKEQRRINQLALLGRDIDRPMLQSLASPASGGIIAAETGEGKTTIARRALEVFAPQQVVVHAPSQAGGWTRFTQICYLHVDLPFNGSRGGLLARIIGGVDALIGSDYSEKLRKLRNLDAQVVFVMKILSMHRVGALVLDEGQQDNFDECAWQREFVLFFLAVMNFGIPILLCGHPSAFTSLFVVGQVMRRFSDIGYFPLRRAADVSDESWSKAYVPGVMRFLLCETVEDAEKIILCSHEETGGGRGLFVARWLEAQRIALLRRGTTATVTLADFQQSRHSPRCTELYRMARWMGGHVQAGAFDDVSSAPAAAASGSDTAPPVEPGSEGTTADRKAVPKAIQRLMKDAQRRAKEKERKANKDAELLKNTKPDDLRTSMRVLEIMAGLGDAQRELLGA
jgi:hypothetical protein